MKHTHLFVDTFTCDVYVFIGELSPSIMEQQKREQILASLERFIRKEYNGVYKGFPELTNNQKIQSVN